ncbi:hypothetical protein C8R44DRAFT_745748 [Mycena epipterygia]|nr:hypothetical protein C8R44DRAFT_745748 [Mycena epipterygia]
MYHHPCDQHTHPDVGSFGKRLRVLVYATLLAVRSVIATSLCPAVMVSVIPMPLGLGDTYQWVTPNPDFQYIRHPIWKDLRWRDHQTASAEHAHCQWAVAH